MRHATAGHASYTYDRKRQLNFTVDGRLAIEVMSLGPTLTQSGGSGAAKKDDE